MIEFKDKEEARAFSELFYAMGRICGRINHNLEGNLTILDNPRWGLEMEFDNKKYRLILELTEVKNESN